MTDVWIPHYEARSARWRWQDRRNGETGTYRLGSVTARVDDGDGDFADYEVRQNDVVVLEGRSVDFDQAIKAVEDQLVTMGWLAPEPYGAEAAA